MAGGGHAAGALRELTEDGPVECLLEALRKDLPHSVHIFNEISTFLRWRREGLVGPGGDIRVAIYRAAEEGDATDGPATAVATMTVKGVAETMVALHSTDPEALRRVLASSTEAAGPFPWRQNILFESVHERCLPLLLDELRARGDPAPKEYRTDKMLLPAAQCAALDVGDPGPGLSLRPLEPRHAKTVNDNWPYGTASSEHMLAEVIGRNPGLSWGVFPDGDPAGEPVAFVIGKWYGGLGILHTMESHRRRGLGALVVRAAARALASRHGLDAHANIVFPNPASEATLGKVGFRRLCFCAWVDYTAPTSDKN